MKGKENTSRAISPITRTEMTSLRLLPDSVGARMLLEGGACLCYVYNIFCSLQLFLRRRDASARQRARGATPVQNGDNCFPPLLFPLRLDWLLALLDFLLGLWALNLSMARDKKSNLPAEGHRKTPGYTYLEQRHLTSTTMMPSFLQTTC